MVWAAAHGRKGRPALKMCVANKMAPTLPRLLAEAAVVGVALLALVRVLEPLLRATGVVPAALLSTATLILAGAAFHVLAEVAGVNAWYVAQY